MKAVVTSEKRNPQGPDRRLFPRGGRRTSDQPGRHPAITIIERYEGVRRPCVRYLEHFNFDVSEAGDPDEGVALLTVTRPAVVLLEDKKSAGFERLQRQALTLSIPVVSMATDFSNEDAARKHVTYAAGVLLKPFSLGTMLDEIRRVIRLARTAVQGQEG